jgi:TRAP-type C4-dicarboxylate transport system substrate-binding protein
MRTAQWMVAWGLVAALGAAPAGATEIKMATLAPKGSAWAKIMEKGAAQVKEKTAGRVEIKYFFSGQQGDEREVVRKMKLGQLDGAAVTAVGMGLIKPDVRVLELPFLFENDKQLDYVRDKLAPDFEKEFDEAGYVLLAWGDVGWTHVLSGSMIENKDQLKAAKFWAWNDDAIVRELFQILGVNGVPMGVPDVLPALQTGSINACYGSPLAAVALQWASKVSYAGVPPISYSVGALVIKKDLFNTLSAEDQAAIREIGKTVSADLITVVRRDNEKARKAMEKQGVKFVDMPAPLLKDLQDAGKQVQDNLSGKLYSKELLAKVKAAIAEAPK